MTGKYFICPVCNKSHTDKKTEERKELIRFCPECGREMKTVEFRMSSLDKIGRRECGFMV